MTEAKQGFIIDTPEQLSLFRLLQWKYALRIEVRTGMRHSRGSIKKLVDRHLAQYYEPCKGKQYPQTKAKTLENLEAYIDEIEAKLTEDPA